MGLPLLGEYVRSKRVPLENLERLARGMGVDVRRSPAYRRLLEELIGARELELIRAGARTRGRRTNT